MHCAIVICKKQVSARHLADIWQCKALSLRLVEGGYSAISIYGRPGHFAQLQQPEAQTKCMPLYQHLDVISITLQSSAYIRGSSPEAEFGMLLHDMQQQKKEKNQSSACKGD